MKIATMSQTRNNVSALLDYVRAGESVLITDRARPVAQLRAVDPSAGDSPEGRLLWLRRAGL